MRSGGPDEGLLLSWWRQEWEEDRYVDYVKD